MNEKEIISDYIVSKYAPTYNTSYAKVANGSMHEKEWVLELIEMENGLPL